jgi:hypothetical protein
MKVAGHSLIRKHMVAAQGFCLWMYRNDRR